VRVRAIPPSKAWSEGGEILQISQKTLLVLVRFDDGTSNWIASERCSVEGARPPWWRKGGE
jgi:phage baseplate assembly protein gpV